MRWTTGGAKTGRRRNLETSADLLLIARYTGWSRAEILGLPRSEFDLYLNLLEESNG